MSYRLRAILLWLVPPAVIAPAAWAVSRYVLYPEPQIFCVI